MRISRYICCHSNNELLDLLNKWGGDYKEEDWDGLKVVMFTIFTDEEFYDEIIEKSYDIYDGEKIPVEGFFSSHYTKKELEIAEWLLVRSTNLSINIEREEDSFDFIYESDEDWHASKNENPLFIRNYKWKTRQHFNTMYEMPYEVLFCDDKIKELLEKNCIGFCFENVYNFRTEKVVPDLYKLYSNHRIGKNDISWNRGVVEYRCSYCGRTSYDIDDTFDLHVKRNAITVNTDVWLTPEIFGTGTWDHSLTVISNKAFRLLRENKMDRGLKFFPVIIDE